MSGLNWTPEQVAAHYQKLGLEPPKDLCAVNKSAKYRNVKKEIDGITFDSTKEAKRYVELKLLRDAGQISQLKLQPRFLLQDGVESGGRKVREISYVADFSYLDPGGRLIVEDVKGMKTQTFRLKEKLFRAAYPDIELRIT